MFLHKHEISYILKCHCNITRLFIAFIANTMKIWKKGDNNKDVVESRERERERVHVAVKPNIELIVVTLLSILTK